MFHIKYDILINLIIKYFTIAFLCVSNILVSWITRASRWCTIKCSYIRWITVYTIVYITSITM